MAVTSSSTLAEVEAQFDDNVDYDTPPSLAKAQAFIQAGRILLRRYKASASQRGTTLTRDIGTIADQVDEAVKWYRITRGNTGGRGATVVDFRESRT